MIDDEVGFSLISNRRDIPREAIMARFPIDIQGLLKHHVDIIVIDLYNELPPIRISSKRTRVLVQMVGVLISI